MQCVPNPKSTPNRRRPPMGRNRNGAQKVYASESDVPLYRPDAASPSTPQKSLLGGSTAPQTHSTNQKQRNKSNNKNRNTKNGAVSPGRLQQDRGSPSLNSQETSAPIFAGSSFHASPAPSALPIPRFLGLSNGDSPVPKAQTTRTQEISPPQTDSDEGSPTDEPVPRHDESPLEFFFRADRAEKARVRRASSVNTGVIVTAPFSPPQDSHKECNTSLRRPSLAQRNTSPGICTTELDGNPRLPVGPAFSTPYRERIRAARSNQSSVQTTPVVNRNLDPNSSDALKRYLFTGQLGRSEPQEASPCFSSSPAERSRPPHSIVQQQHGSPAGQGPAPQQASQRPPLPGPSLPRGMFPASVLAGHAPQAQPTASSVHKRSEPSPRSDHILALEGDLRRMLKLDSIG